MQTCVSLPNSSNSMLVSVDARYRRVKLAASCKRSGVYSVAKSNDGDGIEVEGIERW